MGDHALSCESCELGGGEGEVVDVAYDIYGKRMVTCCTDNSIKVWDMVGESWKMTWETKAHRGPITKATWAHPEFGQVFATCSEDGDVLVWGQDGPQSLWRECAKLEGAKVDPQPVVDIAFAPLSSSLRLAVGDGGGQVHMYESRDIMSAGEWTLEDSFAAAAGKNAKCTALCWRPASSAWASLPPYILVATDDCARVWVYREAFGRWEAVADLGSAGAQAVAWAHPHGRDVDLVAVVRGAGAEVWSVSFKAGTADLKAALAESLPHPAPVWKAEWDMLGSTLATSAEDSTVRMWRTNLGGAWFLHTKVVGQEDGPA
eukprot:CAMPEP_0182899302 /NCGR_PEP_ID=MMETSP0034_2-20130328/28003_1 /TAXON_ID=156128 /ORGANISM="Nephroselmis pyriformis, Strain CCMP717" /LENGTH=316 /DNA_ID=CAMNT_0025033323 /DNA_START=103 /DNA_END=1049 /DNA_ORIENTATION=-